MEPTTAQYLVLAVAGLLYGLGKTSVLGLGILVTPIMLAFFTPGQALGLIQPLLLFADVVTIVALRKTVNWRHVAAAAPWGVLGVVIGWRVLAYTQTLPADVAETVLRRIVVVVMTGVVCAGLLQRLAQSRRAAAPAVPGGPVPLWRKVVAAGLAVTGGAVTMVANNSAPVWVIYLAQYRMDKFTFLGTGAWLFLFINASKIPFGAHLGYITADTLGLNLMMAPMTVLGIWLGKKLTGRISQRFFDNLVQGLALAGALYLLLRV